MDERRSTVKLLVARMPIIGLIVFAWLFLGFIIPLAVSYLLSVPTNNVFLLIIMRHIIPLLIFLAFLYLWYKLTNKYYREKAKKLFGG